MWTLANLLTLSRFLTAPVFLALVLAYPSRSPAVAWAAVAVLVVTLVTDMLDGMAARAMRAVTDFGKIMDPVADSTFFLTALFSFSATERFHLPIWMPLIVLYREIGMHVLRRYAALSGVVLAAKASGKAKMAVQSAILLLLTLLIACRDNGWGSGWLPEDLHPWVWWGGLAIVLVNLASLPEYLLFVPTLVRERRAQLRAALETAPSDAPKR